MAGIVKWPSAHRCTKVISLLRCQRKVSMASLDRKLGPTSLILSLIRESIARGPITGGDSWLPKR